MGFIAEWLTNIILLILFATILEMMLPQSSMQRYVKMVVGILLLFVILQPLLSILSEKNMEDLLLTLSNETIQTEQTMTNSINLQKREIESGQRAYISEQVAVQLKKQVTDELKEKYALVIAQIDVEMEEEHETAITQQQMKAVNVQVRFASDEEKAAEQSEIRQVELVDIDASRFVSNEPLEESKQLMDVQKFLSNNWQIPEEAILVEWEGGNEQNES